MAINKKSGAGAVLESVGTAEMAAMTVEVEAEGAEKATGTNPDGQPEGQADGQTGAMAPEMTPEEVERLTDETVGLLLAQGGGEAQEWIEKGRIIAAYVERLQPNGKFTKPNPFTLLAERKDIPWRASQLRTYHKSYLLWRRMGGTDGMEGADGSKGSPKVDVTTVGLVLGLDAEDAKKVLDRAAKEKLTTRQVAALVKKAMGTESAAKPERVAGDWKALGKALEAVESEISLLRDCPPAGPIDLGVVDRLEIVIQSGQALLSSIGPEGGAR